MSTSGTTVVACINNGTSGYTIPSTILDDLCSRFIINIPEEERSDLIRIFFQIELAHWFYLDFYVGLESKDNISSDELNINGLRACGIKDFSAQIFNHCPTLINHAGNVENILGSWREYKMAVPTYGAILLDPSLQHCLLVQGFWAKTSWGFPKGKVNEGEQPKDCSVREVMEETGFDISNMIDDEEYIEYQMNDQLSRLYIIPNVPIDTNFSPKTRKEIKEWYWFRIDHLPAHKKDIACKSHFNLPPNAFFMVIPFVKPLRKWINKQLGKTDSDFEKSNKLVHSYCDINAHRLRPIKLFSSHLSESNNNHSSNKAKECRKSHLSTVELSPNTNGTRQNFKKNRKSCSPKKNRKTPNKKLTPNKKPCNKHIHNDKNIDSDNIEPKDVKEVFNSMAWTNFTLDVQSIIFSLQKL